jgi:hypothetical protein
MFLSFQCPRCESANRTGEIRDLPALQCASCGWTKDLCGHQSAEGTPSACLCCGNSDLWRQKDFPQWLGFTFVALGAISSSIAWGYHRPVLALSILMGFALLDMILYVVMPDVLVCYRCQARHHRMDVGSHGGFNHELAERYRQERIRRRQSSSALQVGIDDIPSLPQR